MKIFWIAAIVLILNMPFDYWRTSVKKLLSQCICAVHFPVPMIVALRIYSGLGWRLAAFPVLIRAFSLGQLIEGKLHNTVYHEG
jgi:hypothetical protein